MIKAKDYEDRVQHARLDAAMLALGFSWDGEAYQSNEAKATKRATVASKKGRKTRKYRPEWTAELYERIEALGHGASMDITTYVRNAGLNVKEAKCRIYGYFYNKGTHKRYLYTVAQTNGIFLVTRI
jgi:hypothetical protein